MAKILVVDDSEIVRNGLTLGLAPAGYNVVTANDGAAGLERLREMRGDIDLVVVDLNMPEVDGLTMIKELRSLPKMGKTPIIVLTTESALHLKAEAKALGVQAWIVKPFDISRLLTLIDVMLHKSVSRLLP